MRRLEGGRSSISDFDHGTGGPAGGRSRAQNRRVKMRDSRFEIRDGLRDGAMGGGSSSSNVMGWLVKGEF